LQPRQTAPESVRLAGMTERMRDDQLQARIKTSSEIAERTAESLPTQEHIRHEVHKANLDDDVRKAIADKIKESIAALDATPQDHSDRDD
jgi:hypothetical protein